ncbi:unnamed protein product [Nezara viridula]|uniref:Uncharacterized protein n=1 Tax=Nezara viridula TaxID=85310 RepID=A0A9P0E751_NEZVI|nr:unnamed protein product [Nezara viridula]
MSSNNPGRSNFHESLSILSKAIDISRLIGIQAELQVLAFNLVEYSNNRYGTNSAFHSTYVNVYKAVNTLQNILDQLLLITVSEFTDQFIEDMRRVGLMD